MGDSMATREASSPDSAASSEEAGRGAGGAIMWPMGAMPGAAM